MIIICVFVAFVWVRWFCVLCEGGCVVWDVACCSDCGWRWLFLLGD